MDLPGPALMNIADTFLPHSVKVTVVEVRVVSPIRTIPRGRVLHNGSPYVAAVTLN